MLLFRALYAACLYSKVSLSGVGKFGRVSVVLELHDNLKGNTKPSVASARNNTMVDLALGNLSTKLDRKNKCWHICHPACLGCVVKFLQNLLPKFASTADIT